VRDYRHYAYHQCPACCSSIPLDTLSDEDAPVLCPACSCTLYRINVYPRDSSPDIAVDVASVVYRWQRCDMPVWYACDSPWDSLYPVP
jgi:hypothetical protein